MMKKEKGSEVEDDAVGRGRRFVRRSSRARDKNGETEAETRTVSISSEEMSEKDLSRKDRPVLDILKETPLEPIRMERNFPRTISPNVYKPNTWDEAPFSEFRIRGPHYLGPGFRDRKKIVADSTACELIALDALRTTNGHRPMIDVGRIRLNTLHGLIADDDRLIFINFMLPAESIEAPHVSLFYMYKVKKDNIKFIQMLDHFTETNDSDRNERFKVIPSVKDGPWIARHALGQRPALVGRNLTTHYFFGQNYIEIDIDVSTNTIANGIWRILKDAGKLLVTDVAFLFEAKTQDELPEILLGTGRISYFDLTDPNNSAFTHLVAIDHDDIHDHDQPKFIVAAQSSPSPSPTSILRH